MNSKILETLIGLRDSINDVIGIIKHEKSESNIPFDSKVRLFEKYITNIDNYSKFDVLSSNLHWYANQMREYGLTILYQERYNHHIELQMHAPKTIDGRCMGNITTYTILPANDERTNAIREACDRAIKTNSDYMLIEYMWNNFPTFKTRDSREASLCKYIDKKF